MSNYKLTRLATISVVGQIFPHVMLYVFLFSMLSTYLLSTSTLSIINIHAGLAKNYLTTFKKVDHNKWS